MKVKALLLGAFICAIGAAGNAGQSVNLGQVTKPEVFKSKSGKTLKYRLYLPPNYNGEKKYPLVLFFHGAGERGDDNSRQMVHGIKDLITYSLKHKEPMILIAPQCPKGQQWVNTPWGNLSHTMPKEPSQAMQLAMALLQKMITTYSVDNNRLYVTGLSMGGFGTWDIIQRQPKRFAAALAICGGGDTAEAKKLIKLPIWATHGDQDRVVKTKRSRDMVAAIKKAGGNPKYTEFTKTGHGAWGPTYRNEQMLKWFFSQKKQ